LLALGIKTKSLALSAAPNWVLMHIGENHPHGMGLQNVSKGLIVMRSDEISASPVIRSRQWVGNHYPLFPSSSCCLPQANCCSNEMLTCSTSEQLFIIRSVMEHEKILYYGHKASIAVFRGLD
jgi:hypothetical protein